MKDEFGGIALEDTPATDEFGGIAIEEPRTEQKTDEFGGVAVEEENPHRAIGSMPTSPFGADIQPPVDPMAPLRANPLAPDRVPLQPLQRPTFRPTDIPPDPAELRRIAVEEETWNQLNWKERQLSNLSRGAQNLISGFGQNVEGAGIASELLPAPSEDLPTTLAFMKQGVFDRKTPQESRAAIEANPLYQAGQSMKDFAEKSFPRIQPESVNQPLGALAEGVGSTVSFLPGMLAGPAGVAAMGAFQNGAQAYDEARQKGASEEASQTAFWINAIAGTSEAVPVEHFFKRLDKIVGGKLSEALITAGKSGAEEGLQEVFQQIVGNVAAEQLYDENREYLDGLFKSGGVGFGTGALLSALGLAIHGTAKTAGTVERGLDFVPRGAGIGNGAPEVQRTVPFVPPAATAPTPEWTKALMDLKLEGVTEEDAKALLSGDKTVKQVVEGNFKITPSRVVGPEQGHDEAFQEGYNQALERLGNILDTFNKKPNEEEDRDNVLKNLRPAIEMGKDVIEGEHGESHDQLLGKQEGEAKARLTVDGVKGFTLGDGKFLTREQAAELLGEKDPLKTERLAELRKPTTKTTTTTAATPAEAFIAFAMKTGELTQEQAVKALGEYEKAKVYRSDEKAGTFTLKHKRYSTREALRNAAGLDIVVKEKAPRKPTERTYEIKTVTKKGVTKYQVHEHRIGQRHRTTITTFDTEAEAKAHLEEQKAIGEGAHTKFDALVLEHAPRAGWVNAGEALALSTYVGKQRQGGQQGITERKNFFKALAVARKNAAVALGISEKEAENATDSIPGRAKLLGRLQEWIAKNPPSSGPVATGKMVVSSLDVGDKYKVQGEVFVVLSKNAKTGNVTVRGEKSGLKTLRGVDALTIDDGSLESAGYKPEVDEEGNTLFGRTPKKEITFASARKSMPKLLFASFDPFHHKTVSDLQALGEHELDLYREGEETNIQSPAQARQVEKWLKSLEAYENPIAKLMREQQELSEVDTDPKEAELVADWTRLTPEEKAAYEAASKRIEEGTDTEADHTLQDELEDKFYVRKEETPQGARSKKHVAPQLELPGQEAIFNLAGEQVKEEAPAKPEGEKTKEVVPPEQTDLFGGTAPQGAVATGVPPLIPSTPVPASLPVKSQRKIIEALAKGLKVPIRFGRLRYPKYAGYFLPRARLITSKKANHIPIVSHEVGHLLDQTFSLSSNPSIASELNVLGDPATPGSYSSWTKSKTLAYKMGEGVAEFVRLWLTNPAKALADAPNTHAAFEAALATNTEIGDVMRTAQKDIHTWQTAHYKERFRSHISRGEDPNKQPYWADHWTRDLVDDLHFLRLAVDDAAKYLGRPLTSMENFYLLARNLRGSYGMADTFIRHGIANFRTKAVTLGTSLEDALKPVQGRMLDFGDWILAKQAQELHRMGRETGFLHSDVDRVVADHEHDPVFQEAFRKVKAWNDALLQYAIDAGLVQQGTPRIPATATTPEIRPTGAYAMRELYQDFVPLHRVFEVGAGEAPAVAGGGTGRGLNAGKPGSLKQRFESVRDIIDPLETMIKNAYTIITASEKQAINQAVARLATVPNMGKWVEHVGTPKEKLTVSLEKLREQLTNAGADVSSLSDDLMLSFYRNSKHAPFGENIIVVNVNGTPQFFRLDKDLFDTFHALDLDDAGKLVRFLSYPAQLLRAGVTSEPSFGLFNVLRDTFGAAILSKYNALPFEVTIRGFAALINNPKLVAEWAASGGQSAVEASYFDRTKLQQFLREKITKDLTKGQRAILVARSPFAALRFIAGATEEATRIGEYQKAYDALRKRGIPEGEARRQAAYEARDRQDFAKGGAKTKILRHMVPFANAQLQGNVALYQAFKNRPLRTLLQGVGWVTTAKLIEQALNWDDPDYWDRPQWERDLFLMIPTGKGPDGHTRFLRAPLPFLFGVIFGTLPGRIAQWIKANHPNALDGFFKTVLGETVSSPIPPIFLTPLELAVGKEGYSHYRGRSIVPSRLSDEPTELRYTEQTSLTAKKVSHALASVNKNLAVAPLKLDYAVSATTGGLGALAIYQLSDRVISALTGEARTAKGKLPFGRFITTPAAVSSQANEDFYNTLDDLRIAKNAVKAGMKTDLPVKSLETFEDYSKKFAEVNRQIRQEPDENKKTALANARLQKQREIMHDYYTELAKMKH